MKNKIKYMLWMLVLCMGIFFMPVRAHAQADDTAASPATGSAVSAGASDAISGGTPDVGANGDGSGAEETPEDVAEPEEHPFTPEGQATVTDHATDGDGKEFYTFTTPDENVFYLVIDGQREDKNVYFLNAVTEEDLAALAEKSADGDTGSGSVMPEIVVCTCMEKCEAGAVNTDCAVCINDLNGCTGKEAEPEPEEEEPEEPEEPEREGSGGGMAFLLLAVLAAGGTGYYFKVYRPKRELDDAEDLDDLLDDAPEVNEDAEAAEEQEPEVEPEAEGDPYDDYPYDDYPDDGPVQEEP